MKKIKILKKDERKNQFIIQIDSNRSLLMESCHKIAKCEDEEMILIGDVSVVVNGKELKLRQLKNNNILIEGFIDTISFFKEKKTNDI